jgi:hypothetical protein
VKKGRLLAAAGIYGRALDYERSLPAGVGWARSVAELSIGRTVMQSDTATGP